MFSIGITLNPATILSGTSLSGPVALGALTLVGISMPAAWTAAALTFQVSPDGGATWQELVDNAGAAISITAAAATFIMLIGEASFNWRGINMIQVRSGTVGVPVNQGADRIVNLITRSEML
jgi:hypothetical protein